eukprot:scaffold11155_cov141-Isochrysis_galbana.AAC.3
MKSDDKLFIVVCTRLPTSIAVAPHAKAAGSREVSLRAYALAKKTNLCFHGRPTVAIARASSKRL